MVKQAVTVISESGLHARPANMLVKNAQRFSSSVEVSSEGKAYNAKSILGVLAAGINRGMKIEVVCSGEDEKEACDTLVKLIEAGLGE